MSFNSLNWLMEKIYQGFFSQYDCKKNEDKKEESLTNLMLLLF